MPITIATTIDPSGKRGMGFDELTDALLFNQGSHGHVHAGRHFTASDYDAGLVAATTKEWLFKTTTKEPHFKFEFSPSASGFLELFEGTTVSADGTPITIFNNLRESLVVSLSSFFKDPIVTGAGTRLFISSSGNDSAPVKINSILEREREIILKQSTNYLIRYNPLSNQRASLELIFYEL